MSIRLKVLINISVVLVLVIVVMFFLSRFLILKNLAEAENEEAVLHMQGLSVLVQKDIDALNDITLDWASWDDTYEFIVDRNQDYIDSNLVTGTLIDLNLNFIVALDTSGEIVYAKAYDFNNDSEIALTSTVEGYIVSNNHLMNHAGDDCSGFVLLPDLPPVMLSCKPILPSLEDQPSRGYLIFGRFYSSSWVESLNIYSNSVVTLHTMNDDEIPDDVGEMFTSKILDGTNAFARSLDNDYLAGYARINDVYDDPALLLKLQMPRDIYNNGKAGITTLMFVLSGIGVVVIALALFMADKEGLSRLRYLSVNVDRIGVSGDLTQRVEYTGKDEISSLSKNINVMLDTLQNLHDKEAELSRQLEMEMNRRTDFMRALVHELRTPLTPILTTSEMLLDEVSDELDRSMIDNIYRGATRLNKRITELLDFSRGEVGGLEIDVTDIDPAGLIWEVYEELKPEVEKRKKTLELFVSGELPVIRGDEDRIKQVLSNLIDNAAKYSVREDTIIVSASVEGDNLVVSVQDHGPGIAPGNIEHLFDPYYRANKEQGSVGGLGLGLPLCRSIVELHNGTIAVESRPGEGSVFTFSLPLNDPHRSQNNESTGN